METWLVQIATNVPIPVLTVLMIYWGRLIPRNHYLFALKQMEFWRDIALKNQESLNSQLGISTTQAETISRFNESAELQKKVMEEVHKALKQKEAQ